MKELFSGMSPMSVGLILGLQIFAISICVLHYLHTKGKVRLPYEGKDEMEIPAPFDFILCFCLPISLLASWAIIASDIIMGFIGVCYLIGKLLT